MYMQNNFQCDVVVVGGGPSGVITAISVAKSGYSVVILDKKPLDKIGDKTCGDAIDGAAFQRLHDGLGIEFPTNSELSDKIEKMSIAVNNINNKLTLDAPGYLVDRHKLGQRLIHNAIDLGVKIIDKAIVRDLLIENKNGETYICGVKYIKDGIHTIRSKITVDASGAYAIVRRNLPKNLLKFGLKHELDDNEQWPTYREIIELDEDHNFEGEIILKYDAKYPPPGYFWIFSKGRRKLNVGIGWLKSQKLGNLKTKYQEEMDLYFPNRNYKIIKRGGGQIPFRIPFDSCVFNGGALVGDAACMVHPVTAEGHGPALDTAQHLGLSIINALEKNDFSENALWSYNLAISKHYGRKHAEAEILRKLIVNIGVHGLDILIKSKVFDEDEMNLMFSGGTLELSLMDKIKRVVKLLRYPRILFQLKNTLSKIDKCKNIYSIYPSNPTELDRWRKNRNLVLDFSY